MGNVNKLIYSFPNPKIEGVHYVVLGAGEVAICSTPHSEEEPNGDSGFFMQTSKSSIVLAVADGVGGHAGGPEASLATIKNLEACLSRKHIQGHRKSLLVDSFEKANAEILDLHPGAATTLVVAEIDHKGTRFYVAGDSIALVLDPEGHILYRTIAHNPIDLGIEAGLIEPGTYDYEDMRHYVTNYLGSHHMRIDFTARQQFPKNAIYILGSDGLFDNLSDDAISEFVATTPDLDELALKISDKSSRNMVDGRRKDYSKPDDLTFILFRK